MDDNLTFSSRDSPENHPQEQRQEQRQQPPHESNVVFLRGVGSMLCAGCTRRAKDEAMRTQFSFFIAAVVGCSLSLLRMRLVGCWHRNQTNRLCACLTWCARMLLFPSRRCCRFPTVDPPQDRPKVQRFTGVVYATMPKHSCVTFL